MHVLTHTHRPMGSSIPWKERAQRRSECDLGVAPSPTRSMRGGAWKMAKACICYVVVRSRGLCIVSHACVRVCV